MVCSRKERGQRFGNALGHGCLALGIQRRPLKEHDAVVIDVDELKHVAIDDVDVVWLSVRLHVVAEGWVVSLLRLHPGSSGAVLAYPQNLARIVLNRPANGPACALLRRTRLKRRSNQSGDGEPIT